MIIKIPESGKNVNSSEAFRDFYGSLSGIGIFFIYTFFEKCINNIPLS